MSSSGGGDGEGPGGGGGDVAPPPQARNPLLCFLCEDYYHDPCLLSCFHTFCARCLRGRDLDGKIPCPLCCQTTPLKEGASLPPNDILMRQLIEWANAENPPCANCDKRNKNSMYFCSTCGQALCEHCRENTHKAKMFSTHDVVHMSKCAREGHKRWPKAREQLRQAAHDACSSLESQLRPWLKRACRAFLLCQQCAVHGEQFIMFSNSQKNMLCVNCFRDTPQEARLHCVDIDSAYTQGCKKLDRAVLSVCDLQSSVREGVILFKTLLEELRRNMESEKHTINNFCQGLQEALAKTHSSMIMEIQRQFETKERQFRGQLVSLGTMLPLLQLHLLLCTTFSTSANKYQFLELAYPMMDRLASVSQLGHPLRPLQSSQIRTNYRSEFAHSLEPWVGKGLSGNAKASSLGDMVHSVEGGQFDGQSGGTGQQQVHPHAATTRRQHSALRAKALEGEGPFSNHCRSFDTQIKELSDQLVNVKDSLGELHRDVTVLRRAHTRPLSSRYELVTRECHSLDQQLEQHQVELDRLKAVFDTLWEEQLCRIHVEQEIFTSQMNDIVTLRTEVKHLSTVAHQLEPYVKSLVASEQTSQAVPTESQEAPASHQQLQSLLEQISLLQHDAVASNFRIDAQKSECKVHSAQSVMSPTAENIMYMKVDGKDVPVREIPRCRTPSSREQLEAASAAGVLYPTTRSSHRQLARESSQDAKRGVLSQLIDKVDCRQVRSKEDRKKSPVQEDVTVRVRERAKSDGRVNVEGTRPKTPSSADDIKHTSVKCPQYKAAVKESTGGGISRHASTQQQQQQVAAAAAKVATLYHSLSSGSGGGKRDDHGATHHRRSHSQSMQEVSAAEIADVRERLETHLKEKLHDMLTRSSRMNKDEEADYQRLADANEGQRSPGVPTQQAVRALVHREPNTAAASTPSSPRRKSSGRLYPSSDTDEPCPMETAKRRQASCESLSLSTLSVASPRHSIDLADRKTLVVVIGTTSKGKSRLMQKQRSWETFPPKKRGFDEGGGGSAGSSGSRDSGKFCKDTEAFHGGFSSKSLHLRHGSGDGTLKKADSFEGHEEAVRTLVAAVQETRSQQMQQQQQQRKGKSGN